MLHCDELGRVARALVLVFAVAFRHPSIDTTSSDAAAEASNVFAADASRVVAASLELPSEEEVPTVWGTLSVEDDAGSEAFDAAAAAAAVLLARESSSVLAERVETITLGCSVLEQIFPKIGSPISSKAFSWPSRNQAGDLQDPLNRSGGTWLVRTLAVFALALPKVLGRPLPTMMLQGRALVARELEIGLGYGEAETAVAAAPFDPSLESWLPGDGQGGRDPGAAGVAIAVLRVFSSPALSLDRGNPGSVPLYVPLLLRVLVCFIGVERVVGAAVSTLSELLVMRQQDLSDPRKANSDGEFDFPVERGIKEDKHASRQYHDAIVATRAASAAGPLVFPQGASVPRRVKGWELQLVTFDSWIASEADAADSVVAPAAVCRHDAAIALLWDLLGPGRIGRHCRRDSGAEISLHVVRVAVFACLVGLADIVGLPRVLSVAPPVNRADRPPPLPLNDTESVSGLPRAVTKDAIDAAVSSLRKMARPMQTSLLVDMRAFVSAYRGLCDPGTRRAACISSDDTSSDSVRNVGFKTWVHRVLAAAALRCALAVPSHDPYPEQESLELSVAFGYGNPLEALLHCYAEAPASGPVHRVNTAAPSFRQSFERLQIITAVSSGQSSTHVDPSEQTRSSDTAPLDTEVQAVRTSAGAHARLLRCSRNTKESTGNMWLPFSAETCKMDFKGASDRFTSGTLHLQHFRSSAVYPATTAPLSCSAPFDIGRVSFAVSDPGRVLSVINALEELLSVITPSSSNNEDERGMIHLLQSGILELVCWISTALTNYIAASTPPTFEERVVTFMNLSAVVRRLVLALSTFFKRWLYETNAASYDTNPQWAAPSTLPAIVRLLSVGFTDGETMHMLSDVLRSEISKYEDNLRKLADPDVGQTPQSLWASSFFWAIPGSLQVATDTLIFWSCDSTMQSELNSFLSASSAEPVPILPSVAASEMWYECAAFFLSSMLSDGGASAALRRDFLATPRILSSLRFAIENVAPSALGAFARIIGKAVRKAPEQRNVVSSFQDGRILIALTSRAGRLLEEADGVYYADDVVACAGELMTRDTRASAVVFAAGGLSIFGKLLGTSEAGVEGVISGILPLLSSPIDSVSGSARFAALCLVLANSVRGGTSVITSASTLADRFAACTQGMGILFQRLSEDSSSIVIAKLIAAIASCLCEPSNDCPPAVSTFDPLLACAMPDLITGPALLRSFSRYLKKEDNGARYLYESVACHDDLLVFSSRGCDLLASIATVVRVCPGVALDVIRSEDLIARIYTWAIHNLETRSCVEALLVFIPALLSAAQEAEAAEAEARHRLGTSIAFEARYQARLRRLLTSASPEDASSVEVCQQIFNALMSDQIAIYSDIQAAALYLADLTDEELWALVLQAITKQGLEGSCQVVPWPGLSTAQATTAADPPAFRSAAQQRKAERTLRALLARGAPAPDADSTLPRWECECGGSNMGSRTHCHLCGTLRVGSQHKPDKSKQTKPRPQNAWLFIARALQCHAGVVPVERVAAAALAALTGLPAVAHGVSPAAEVKMKSVMRSGGRHRDKASSTARHGGVPDTDPDEEVTNLADSTGKVQYDVETLQPFVTEVAVLLCGCDDDATPAEAETACRFASSVVASHPAVASVLRACQPAAISTLQAVLLAHGPQLRRKLPPAVLRTVASLCDLLPAAV